MKFWSWEVGVTSGGGASRLLTLISAHQKYGKRGSAMKYESIAIAGLAERLAAARKAANVTQEAAANHLNMSRPTYIAIEKAARRPKPDELVKLAELYKEPLNKLLRADP